MTLTNGRPIALVPRERTSQPRMSQPALDESAAVRVLRRPIQRFAKGSLIAGKFLVEECIGQGGMATVYAVRHTLTRHRRALKLLHSQRAESSDTVRRFLNEASAAGRAGSAHLVETYDAGVLDSGEPYLVMELLEGHTFSALIERAGKLTCELACELVAQAAEGMEAAHRARIVHRDLKPENLFVVQRSDGPFVKILDFGISKLNASYAEQHSTAAGIVFGTPAYMAPELLRGAHDVDGRADVFALGAVLFECLAGESPFAAGSTQETVARILAGQSTPLQELRPGLDPRLVEVLRAAIAHDRQQRPASAGVLAQLLAPFRTPRAEAPVLESGRITPLLPPEVDPLPASRQTLGMRELAIALVVLMLSIGAIASWRRARQDPAPLLQRETTVFVQRAAQPKLQVTPLAAPLPLVTSTVSESVPPSKRQVRRLAREAKRAVLTP